MGGQAFTHGKVILQCPRMKPAMYLMTRDNVKLILEKYYTHVATPKENPGKPDFGDVDYLVYGSVDCEAPDRSGIANAIGAKHYVGTEEGTASFAIPSINEETDTYTQIDINICKTLEQLQWQSFNHSYGDMTQILAQSLRPLAVVFLPTGLHIIAKYIEKACKEGQNVSRDFSRMLLTSEPTLAMQFLGLDVERYQRGFETEHEVFDWLSSGPYFNRATFERNSVYVSSLTAKQRKDDQQRKDTRTSYARFIDEYLPSNPDRGSCSTSLEPDVLVRKAMDYFGIEQEWNRRIRHTNLQVMSNDLWKRVREELKLSNKRKQALVLKSLRKWVVFKDRLPVLTSDRTCDDKGNDFEWVENALSQDETVAWILANWREAYKREKQWVIECIFMIDPDIYT